jgi:hypothetical protein
MTSQIRRVRLGASALRMRSSVHRMTDDVRQGEFRGTGFASASSAAVFKIATHPDGSGALEAARSHPCTMVCLLIFVSHLQFHRSQFLGRRRRCWKRRARSYVLLGCRVGGGCGAAAAALGPRAAAAGQTARVRILLSSLSPAQKLLHRGLPRPQPTQPLGWHGCEPVLEHDAGNGARGAA